MTKRSKIFYLILAAVALFYVVHTEMRLNAQERQHSWFETRAVAAMSLIIQAVADVHQRVKKFEDRGSI